MAKHYALVRIVLAVFILGCSAFGLHAQIIEYLNSNNVNAGIARGGNLFTKVDSLYNLGSGNADTGITWDLFETPPGTNKREVFTAALWLAGYDNTGAYHCAGNAYFEYGVDYYDGPIAANYTSNYDQYYKRVFKVTQTQISQFRSLTFPATAAQVDSAILYWPGAGNASVLSNYGVAIDSPLAPFVDYNHNGIYEPLLGEYPAIPGDQGIFFVYNDIRGPHTESGGTPIGVEIRGLASCFTDPANPNIPYYKNAVNNSIFVQYQIENKSQDTFSLFHIGMYVDPDIGCLDNDYVGCDSARAMMFAYNGVPYDPDCAPELGYDSIPVALGVQVLSLPLDVFLYFTGGPGVAITDPDPEALCKAYMDYAQGRWADSTYIEYGRSGYNSGGYPTSYCFPGDPTDTAQWSEVSAQTAPGNRAMLGVSSALNFVPGQTLNYDIGWTSARDSTSNHISIVDSLKNDADSVRHFYLHHLLHQEQILAINPIPPPTPFTISIFPNPAHNNLTIMATGDNMQAVELMDIQGRVILRKTVEAMHTTLSVANLAKGVYLLNVFSAGNTVVKKVVVE